MSNHGQGSKTRSNGSLSIGVYTKPKSLNCIYTWDMFYTMQDACFYCDQFNLLRMYILCFFCCRLAAEVASTTRLTSLYDENIGASQLALACTS